MAEKTLIVREGDAPSGSDSPSRKDGASTHSNNGMSPPLLQEIAQ